LPIKSGTSIIFTNKMIRHMPFVAVKPYPALFAGPRVLREISLNFRLVTLQTISTLVGGPQWTKVDGSGN
jgi:hypothetical protein